MAVPRTKRLNSLLKKVIAEVVASDDLKDPRICKLAAITSVDISKDLQHAKVYVSVIDTNVREETLRALNQAAGFISVSASKKVDLRYFPKLVFKPDLTAEKHMHMEMLLKKIKADKPPAKDTPTK